MEKRSVIMLYSGGADSYAMLQLARYVYKVNKVHCVLIDYGQKHINELSYAKKQLISLDVPYSEVKVEFNKKINSALTGNNESVNRTHVSYWHVPSRNMLFISIAAAFAESMKFNEIWYGADYSDFEHEFPDCYQVWVGKMNELLKVNGYDVKLHAPLLGVSKEEALQICNEYNDGVKIYSGYDEPEKNNDKLDASKLDAGDECCENPFVGM